jgi:DNA-binding PadR family transcriptional regulator
MAAVPKGFLRYYVLKLMSEKPMSGSEIMTEIAKRTHSHWKPSPGSVYPLLAWLQEKGYSKEVPEQEPGTKRYALTDQGKAFLEEHEKRREKFRKRTGFFPPPFIGLHWFDHYPKKANELVEAGKRLVMSSWNLLANLREGYSEDAVVKATEGLEQAAKRIEEIASRLKDMHVE